LTNGVRVGVILDTCNDLSAAGDLLGAIIVGSQILTARTCDAANHL
jgi:hypothetical protein